MPVNEESFETIVESVINGQWKQAARQALSAEFDSNSLIEYHDNNLRLLGGPMFNSPYDIARLVDIMWEIKTDGYTIDHYHSH